MIERSSCHFSIFIGEWTFEEAYESSMIFGDKQRNQFKKFSTWILFWLWKLENNTQLRKLCHDSKFTFNDLFTHTKTWLIKTCANSGQVTRKTNHKT